MKIYFKTNYTKDSFFNQDNVDTLTLTSVNYKRADSQFYVEINEQSLPSLSGYDIIERLKQLQVLKEDNHRLVAGTQLPLYKQLVGWYYE